MNNPSLFQAFQASVLRHAQLPAFHSDGVELNFEQTEAAALEIGVGLMALGVERGDRIAIWGVNSVPWALAGLGLQAAGAALVLLGTRLRGREVAGILQDSGARIVFADQGFGSFDFVDALLEVAPPAVEKIVVMDQDAQPHASDKVITLAELRELGGATSREALEQRIADGSGDDLADLIFTSGTTGKPKGVPMTQAQSLEACRIQQAEISFFSPGETFAVSYPFAHNAGYRAGWQISMLEGVCVIPIRQFDAGEMIRLIEEHKVAYLPVVPTLAQAILDHPDRDKHDLSSLRILATGATTIPIKLIRDLHAFFGGKTAIVTGYGLTEAAGSVTTTYLDDPAEVVVNTVGHALSNLDVRIYDRDHKELPVGETGEITVKGPQVMTAYYQDPDATAAAMTKDGYLLTGDAGWIDEDGNVHIADRIKDMYLVGGFNCYPAEIENLMLAMEGIAKVAVIGVDDERLGQVGRAFVVRSPGSQIGEKDVIDWCRKEMANYKAPRSVRFVDALPLNSSGKVAKMELRELE